MSQQPVYGDDYRLLWRLSAEGCIGEVRNYAADRREYRVVPVLVDDELMTRISMRFLVTSWGSRGPAITASKDFTALGREFKEAGIWHEMGHIHHEHHLKFEYSDQAQLRAARIAAIENAQVMPQETEADKFAVTRAGKEALIGFLSHLFETRPTGGRQGWNDLGRRELELRIKAIQEL